MKIILLLLLCVYSSIAAFGQTFSKGYVVTFQGDTINGYLKRNTNMEMAKSVTFSSSGPQGNTTEYGFNDLTAFGFEDIRFETVRYQNPFDTSRMQTEFARLALRGHYNVYVLARATLANYLVSGKDTSYVLYDDEIDFYNNMLEEYKRITRLGNYRNMLAFLARDCMNKNLVFDKIQFNERDIVQVISRINECYQSTSVVHAQKARYEMKVVVHAGGSYLKENSSQVSAGGEFRVRNANISRKLWYVAGLHYARTNEIAVYRNYGREERENRITEIYSLPATLHYTFTERIIQPYIYVGFSAAYKRTNYRSPIRDSGFQGRYGFALVGGIGIEAYPASFIAIKADWRYELLLQYPALGVAIRF